MRGFSPFASGAFLLSLSAALAGACEITVRDSSFQAVRDVHRLCLMIKKGDDSAQALQQRLTAWLEGQGGKLNLELTSVDVDDPQVRWEEYGIPSPPPSVPVVVLVGRDHAGGRNFVIDYWEPGPSSEALETLASSPLREAISQELCRRVAVILHAPATGSGATPADSAVQQTLDEIVAQWSTGDGLGVSVIRVDRTDLRERTLLRFIGLPPDGPDWVGVVFGQGKLMTPPLVGSEISVDRLNQLLEQLGQDCSCPKPSPTLGVDPPRAWHDALDESVVLMQPLEEAAASVLNALGSQRGNNDDERLDAPESSLVAMAFWTVGALVAVVVASSAGLLWWKRHQDLNP